MNSVVFERFGNPAEVLEIRDRPIPVPGPGEVRIRMIASPINPSDLLVVHGLYPRLPIPPATPGFEGVGTVDAVGSGLLRHVRGLRPGRRVAVLNSRGGNWQEYVVIPARQAVPIPSQMSVEQAASFFVNPASALVMVRDVLKVPAGAWLIQTAAGSALGRMVLRLGKHQGFRTINIVRRRQQAQELLDMGGNAVICSGEESIEKRAKEITNGIGPAFGLDAVGGATGAEVIRALGHGGRLLAYGVLSGEPLTIEPRVLMSGNKKVEGFWLTNWVAEQNVWTMLGLFRRLARLIQQGILASEVAASFHLEEVRKAVTLAETPGRKGKILLRMIVN